MDLRKATLRALYDIDGSGPYTGVMLGQIADRIGQGTHAGVLFDPVPKLGLLSRVLDGLVHEGLVEDVLEERIGFENVPGVARMRTYRLSKDLSGEVYDLLRSSSNAFNG